MTRATAPAFSLGPTHRNAVRSCAHCGAANDATTAVEENGKPAHPKPGDATICLSCGEISIYKDDLSLRKPTDDEVIAMAHDPAVNLSRKAWMKMDQSGLIDALRAKPNGADRVLSQRHVRKAR